MDAIPREWLVLMAIGGVFAAWVLLPLVPSVLIYKLFPSTTVTVSGPFAGLTINAGGAFAAYLVVFVGSYLPIVAPATDMVAGFQRQFWTISGQIKLVRPDGSDHPNPGALLKKLRLVQPIVSKFESNEAILKLEETDGELPTVVIDIPDFGEQPVLLRSMLGKITINKFRKTIKLKEPIVIRETSSGGSERPVAALNAHSEQGSTDTSVRPR